MNKLIRYSEPAGFYYDQIGDYTLQILEFEGLKFVYEPDSGDALAIHHEMEPRGRSVHDWICQQFHPGETFLDIGAHEGHYSLRAAKAGCQVIAVEAAPETAAWLHMNRSLNGMDFPIWAFAAWDEYAVLDFQRRPEIDSRPGDNTLSGTRLEGYEPSSVRVAAAPLGPLLAELPRLDFVKMDVEGSDLRVVRGMLEELVRLRPLMILEDHRFYGTYTTEEMDKLLIELSERAGYVWCDLRSLGVESLGLYIVGRPGDGGDRGGDSR